MMVKPDEGNITVRESQEIAKKAGYDVGICINCLRPFIFCMESYGRKLLPITCGRMSCITAAGKP